MSKNIVLVYDTDLKRPACVLLQAAYGADHGLLYRFFDAKTWLLAPTPGMRKLSATAEQWQKVSELKGEVV